MSGRDVKVNDMTNEMFHFKPPLPALSFSGDQSTGATMPLMETHMDASPLNWVRHQHNIFQDNTNHGYSFVPPNERHGLVSNRCGGIRGLPGWQEDPEVFLVVNGLGASSSEAIMEEPWRGEPDDDIMDSVDSNAEADNMIEELANIPREQDQAPSRKRLKPSEEVSLVENIQKTEASNSTPREKEKGRKKMRSLQELMSLSANEEGDDKAAPTGYSPMPPPPLANQPSDSDRIAHRGQMAETRPWLRIHLPVPSAAPTIYPLPVPEHQVHYPTTDTGGRIWRNESDLQRLGKKCYRSPYIT